MAQTLSDAALVVVDMQQVFADPASPWHIAGLAEILPRVTALMPRFRRSVLTRFVAPAEPRGAWAAYYAAYPFALRCPDAPLYALLPPLALIGARCIDATTFSKWGPALQKATGGASALVLCGVATETCVLATALAAADSGVRVHVVPEACAGSAPPVHAAALAVLAAQSPLIELTPLSGL